MHTRGTEYSLSLENLHLLARLYFHGQTIEVAGSLCSSETVSMVADWVTWLGGSDRSSFQLPDSPIRIASPAAQPHKAFPSTHDMSIFKILSLTRS